MITIIFLLYGIKFTHKFVVRYHLVYMITSIREYEKNEKRFMIYGTFLMAKMAKIFVSRSVSCRLSIERFIFTTILYLFKRFYLIQMSKRGIIGPIFHTYAASCGKNMIYYRICRSDLSSSMEFECSTISACQCKQGFIKKRINGVTICDHHRQLREYEKNRKTVKFFMQNSNKIFATLFLGSNFDAK